MITFISQEILSCNATVDELAKHSQMVMFHREALYRLCEQSLNGNIPKDDIPKIYNQIISAATDIVKTDQTAAQAKAQEAENNALQLKLQMK